MAFGVVGAHRIGDLANLDTQRIDAQIGQATARSQPFGQHFGIQHLAVAGAWHGHAGQAGDRMLTALGLGATRNRALRLLDGNDAVGAQPVHDGAPMKRPGGPGGRGGAQFAHCNGCGAGGFHSGIVIHAGCARSAAIFAPAACNQPLWRRPGAAARRARGVAPDAAQAAPGCPRVWA